MPTDNFTAFETMTIFILQQQKKEFLIRKEYAFIWFMNLLMINSYFFFLFQYNCVDKSWFSNNVMHPFWNKCVEVGTYNDFFEYF